jgi:hypothetical protein
MESGGYTYARLKTRGEEIWLAATDLRAKPGERLTIGLDMPMRDFHSRTLNRDFPLIYFVSRVARDGEALAPSSERVQPPSELAMETSHAAATPPSSGPSAGPAPAQVASVEPPAGGLAIADVWAQRAALDGQVVVIRGQVVKANGAIMGRNWFHLQDGSGRAADGTNDVTVTTAEVVRVGDVITVSGTLATGKDFGAGYAYDAIVENARVVGR